jgi:hypothetical protein
MAGVAPEQASGYTFLELPVAEIAVEVDPNATQEVAGRFRAYWDAKSWMNTIPVAHARA